MNDELLAKDAARSCCCPPISVQVYKFGYSVAILILSRPSDANTGIFKENLVLFDKIMMRL